jgi:hypothetical protein
MESVPLKKIRAKAEEYDKSLTASDPRFLRDVTIIHTDATITHYRNAFLMIVKDDKDTRWSWVVCFTEHHGLHIEHSDELYSYWESERRYEDFEEIP